MKRQIRNSVFETNSSSVHSISISKQPIGNIPKLISFNIGEYGWENGTADTADYLYTAIIIQKNPDILLNRLKEILDRYEIEYYFQEPIYEKSNFGSYLNLSYGYIDHGCEMLPIVETLLENEDLLLRYLFGNSEVYTGNDNQEDVPNGCNIASETFWKEDDMGRYKRVANPYHDPENYDYFMKGN